MVGPVFSGFIFVLEQIGSVIKAGVLSIRLFANIFAGHMVTISTRVKRHAEILAIRAAATALGEPRLPDCDLYVTLEPCAMCAAAIGFARIRRVYYGAYDPKGGAVEHGPRWFQQPTCHHQPEVYGGIEEGRAGELLKTFFAARRD